MTTSIPTAALRFPPLPVFLSGTYAPVSDLALPVFAVAMAGQATEEALDKLVDFFTEASTRDPMALVIFLTALTTHKDKLAFYLNNRKCCDAIRSIAKFF